MWRDIKHKSATFFMSDGKLKRRCKPFPQIVVICPELQKAILKALHEEMGHRGMDETYRRTKLQFWWPNMRRIVKKWVQSCLPCQQRSSAKHGEVKRATRAPTIFGKVSMDTVHIKAGKWKYPVVARDDLSGWVEAVGMEKLKASKVAEWFLENWIYKYGLPVAVVVDGGPEFGQDLQQALTKAGTTIKVTTPYYPEENGMIERGHQPLKDALVKLCETDGKKWRHYLPLVLFADRISTKRTTGYSPYELVFGQSAILPVDLELETYLGTDWKKIQSTEELLVARTEQLERREEVIQTAYRKMKEARAKALEPQNNKKSIRKPLEPGSLVLAYNKSLDSQWGKLFANRWNGPYQIEAQEKGGSYVLKELDGSILKRRFSASQIKPFYARGHLSGGSISRS
jgi:transposase-like protein